MAAPAEQAEQIAALERRVKELEALTARFRARDNQSEWLALTACDYSPFTYQTARSWCVDGSVDAYQDRTGHWYVRPASLRACVARKGFQQRSV